MGKVSEKYSETNMENRRELSTKEKTWKKSDESHVVLIFVWPCIIN